MSYQEHILTATQKDVFRRVAPFARTRGFYLAGGTALALWYGHRLSQDFDWFATQLDDSSALWDEVKADGVTLESARTERGTLIGWVDGIRVPLSDFGAPRVVARLRC